MGTLLIAGINGFAGHHLSQAALQAGHTVRGVGREDYLSDALKEKVAAYEVCDLGDKTSVRKLNFAGIDAIVNLAGFAKVGVEESERPMYLKVNIEVHTNLAEALKESGTNTRMVSISSGAVYDPNQPMPLSETSKLQGSESAVYAASKLAMESALKPYQNQGLDIVIARPFNHTGPGQLAGFLLPDLAEQVQMYLKNKSPLRVGNLSTKRDYSDVRDVVRAYLTLAFVSKTDLTASIYNICSGHSIAGTDILKMLLDAYGLSDVPIETDQQKMRKSDASEIFGSYGLLMRDTEWKPQIPIEQTIQDFVTWKKSS